MFTDVVKSTDVRSAFIASVGEVEGNDRFRAEILQPHDHLIEEHVGKYQGKVWSTSVCG